MSLSYLVQTGFEAPMQPAPENLAQFIGLTNVDAPLLNAIESLGGCVDGLSAKQFRDYGNAYVRFRELGVDLVFVPRSAYESVRGPCRGEGPYVLEAVFYYPNGEDSEPYGGIAPFATHSVVDRASALSAYGDPSDTDETDGVVDSDDWVKGDGLQLSCSYREDQSISDICVALPYRG